MYFSLFGSIFLTIAPITASWLIGNWHQNKIVKELLAEEKATLDSIGRDPLVTLEFTVPGYRITNSNMVMANIAVGPSWWQMMIGSIHSWFGGNITSYDRMLAYGRSKALQRLRIEANKQGWDDVINVRLETSTIVKTTGKTDSKSGAFEFLAYGTGIKR